MSERKFAVSADSSSIMGTPRHWREVWESAIKHQNFAGFEMIGWRWSQPFLKEAKKMGFDVLGVHGRTGGKHEASFVADRTVLEALNLLLIPTPELISKYGGTLPYVLVHSPQMRDYKNRVSISGGENIKTLYLENPPQVGAFESTVETVKKMREKGINARVMFDLLHFLKECNHREDQAGFNASWDRILYKLDWLLAQRDDKGPISIGIHLPVGLDPYDSLPVSEITPEMWRSLASRLNGNSRVLVVLENQQGFPGNIYSTPVSRKLQAERNSRILEVLDNGGVI